MLQPSPNTLLSVGIDVGTSTTQLVLSQLVLENRASAYAAPRVEIAQKRVIFESDVQFTPLLDERTIDASGVRAIVADAYERAGVKREEIQTGAVILTGETARKQNAQAVGEALSEFAGDFVVATAGPALESVLAGKGSGAAQYSEQHACAVLNLDIGGGTTNFALFDGGKLLDTGCVNVGGRLVKLSPDRRITYLSPVLRGLTTLSVGQRVCREELLPLAQLLADVLAQAVGLAPKTPVLQALICDKLPQLPEKLPLLSFSGGVADLMRAGAPVWDRFGDLGVLLGQALAAGALGKAPRIAAAQTLRATVVGASSHSTQLSGSTVFAKGVTFPLKNLPAVEYETAAQARAAHERFDRSEPAAFALAGEQNPAFSRVCALAQELAKLYTTAQPLVICLQSDMAKALGQALSCHLPDAPLVSLDGICLRDGDYLDIGVPVMGGLAFPVVVKTLIWKERGSI